MSLSLPHDNTGDKRRTDDSASYHPPAKRRRASVTTNFNGYSFFPINEEELTEEDRRHLMNNLSLLGHHMGQNGIGPADRRRSSTLSILSFLSDGDLLGEDFLSDDARQNENILNSKVPSDRRRSSTLSILSLLSKEDLFDEDLISQCILSEGTQNDVAQTHRILSLLAKEDIFDKDLVPECFLSEGTQNDVAQNEKHLKSMISADDLTPMKNGVALTFPTTTPHQGSQNIITHTASDSSDDSEEEGLIYTTNILPYDAKMIIPTDLDVLFGRGQKINKHPGNQRFRELVNKTRPIYLAQGRSKKKKHALSEQVMETVYAYGGRFLEVQNSTSSIGDSTGFAQNDTVFIEVERKRARKKCSQRLREMR